MPKIRFYLLDLRGVEFENQQAALLFGRTEDNKRVCVIDKSFLPYFYVVPKRGISITEKLEKIEIKVESRISRVLKTEQVKKNICGSSIDAIKIYVPLNDDIKAIKSVIDEWEIIEGIYEYDIPYLMRYTSDKRITITTLIEADAEPFNAGFKVDTYIANSITINIGESITSPKILAFDIETYNPEGRKIDMKKNPIIMLSFYGENLRKVYTWKRFKTDLEYIEFVNSEVDIIEKFIQTIEHYQPDIITGYNTDRFDFPYIQQRAAKYRLNLNIGLDNSPIRFTAGENECVRISGILHIDNYRFIKKNVSLEGSYSLANVSKKLLGEEKKEIELADLYKIWDSGTESIAEYCEYNLVDSKLAYELCRKFLQNIIELAKITGLSIDDITRFGYSQIVEAFIIRKASEFNELIPNKPNKNEIVNRFLESYKGGFVFEPQPGIYNDIVVFDFRSLYPSIIVSHNISPDTIDCNCCAGNKSHDNIIEIREHHFCEKRKGFLPAILEDLITRRRRIKEAKMDDLIKQVSSETLKILANSFYGYLGFYAARWYSIEVAKIITACGRYYIRDVIEKAQKSGFFVIYSDTDSIFLTISDIGERKAFEFLEEINNTLPGKMELEFEGFYKRGLFVSVKEKSAGAKKKYALLTRDGELKIRGFETVRTNWAEVARRVQRTVIGIILKTGNAQDALAYLEKVKEQLRKKEITNKETVIETTLQKDIDKYDYSTPHVAVAKKMQDKGIPILHGMKIGYIIAEGEGRISEKAKLPEEVEEGRYDSEYYIHHQLVPSIEKIFELFNYKKEELFEAKNQTKLDEF